jgi:hypothetical protein
LLLAGSAAAVALIVVLLVLALRSGPRETATHVAQPPSAVGVPSSTPTPEVAREESNAEVVFRNAQAMAARLNWAEAQAFLDRLHGKYGKTAFYAAKKAEIEALQAKVTSVLAPQPPGPEPKKEEPPTPEPKKEEPPKPEPKKEEPPPPKEDPAKKAEQERLAAERKAREEAEAKFAEAMKPIEALVASWDFAAALAPVTHCSHFHLGDGALLSSSSLRPAGPRSGQAEERCDRGGGDRAAG